MGNDTAAFILGIQHFCDHRCWRCGLTRQCAVFARLGEAGDPTAFPPRGPTGRVAASLAASLQVTMEEATITPTSGASEGASLAAGMDGPAEVLSLRRRCERAEQDPLVARGSEYASTSWRILQALRPRLAGRGDAPSADAAERLEETCITVASKVFRAVSGSLAKDNDRADIQSDANGSAKVALLLIEESRQAWRVLMQTGRAAANGVPARLVQLLDALERDLHARFPHALEFVRPGFDTLASGRDRELARAMLHAGSTSRGAPS